MKSNLIPQKLFFLSLLLLLIFSSIGCGKFSSGSSIDQKNKFSGEDIFKAIYFSDGEAADKLPTLNSLSAFDIDSLTTLQKQQKADLEADLIANINKLDPSYFANFEKSLRTRDYNTIDSALANSSNVLIQAGLVSAKYGNDFKNALAITSSADFSKFNLETTAGKSAFKNYILQQYTAPNNLQQRPQGNTCVAVALAAVAVVAAVVWEAAAVVNVVAVATVAVYGAALAVTICNESGGNGGTCGAAPHIVIPAIMRRPEYSDNQDAANQTNQNVIYELANNFYN